MNGERGWFADVRQEPEDGPAGMWQPCLETGIGHVPCLDTWFTTRQACEEWIAANVLGVGMLPRDPGAYWWAALADATGRRGGGTDNIRVPFFPVYPVEAFGGVGVVVDHRVSLLEPVQPVEQDALGTRRQLVPSPAP